jgi:hypothetical protein
MSAIAPDTLYEQDFMLWAEQQGETFQARWRKERGARSA